MTATMTLCLIASGAFLLIGMLLGVWKYHAMLNREAHRAPVYVDLAHRAALLYSFASVVLMMLAEHCVYSQTVQLCAVGVTLLLFVAAEAGYVAHAITEDTDNQFRKRSFATTWGMYVLIAGEIGGVSTLLAGVVAGLIA